MPGKHDHRGKNFYLDELDRAILQDLPLVGSKHGKYLPDGRTVKQLQKNVDPSLPTSLYFGRIAAMRYRGYLIGLKGKSPQNWIYQATEQGKAALKGVSESKFDA